MFKMLDASVSLSTYIHMLTKPIQKLHNVTKNFISYRLCMSIFPPAYLQESGKHQRFSCSLAVRRFLIPPHSDTQTWYPKLRRVFLVSVRERIALSHQHSSPASSGPIFFLFNQSNFEARSSTKEQRNEKETMDGERNSIFFFIPFSFSSHSCSYSALSLLVCVPCSSQ